MRRAWWGKSKTTATERAALEMPQKQRGSPDVSSGTLLTEPWDGWHSVSAQEAHSLCALLKNWCGHVCVCIKVFPKLGRFFQNNYMDNLLVEKIPREILLFIRAKTKFCT